MRSKPSAASRPCRQWIGLCVLVALTLSCSSDAPATASPPADLDELEIRLNSGSSVDLESAVAEGTWQLLEVEPQALDLPLVALDVATATDLGDSLLVVTGEADAVPTKFLVDETSHGFVLLATTLERPADAATSSDSVSEPTSPPTSTPNQPSDPASEPTSPPTSTPNQPPQITQVTTYRDGKLVWLSVSFTDPDGNADGFGFGGRDGVWAEEWHPFTDPSYGRVSPGRVDYPFNHRCGTESPIETDVEFWITDRSGSQSPSVVVHLAC